MPDLPKESFPNSPKKKTTLKISTRYSASL